MGFFNYLMGNKVVLIILMLFFISGSLLINGFVDIGDMRAIAKEIPSVEKSYKDGVFGQPKETVENTMRYTLYKEGNEIVLEYKPTLNGYYRRLKTVATAVKTENGFEWMCDIYRNNQKTITDCYDRLKDAVVLNNDVNKYKKKPKDFQDEKNIEN